MKKVTIKGPALCQMKDMAIGHKFVGHDAHGSAMWLILDTNIPRLAEVCPLYVYGVGWV